MPSEPRLDDQTTDRLRLVYRVVIDGPPGMDGVYKVMTVSQLMTDLRAAKESLRRLQQTGAYLPSNNLRIQHSWQSPWEDLK